MTMSAPFCCCGPDAYGNFILGPNGFLQVILGIGADGLLNTGDDNVLEGKKKTRPS